MPVPVAAIIAHLQELNITPIVRDGNLILKAKPGVITDRCKAVVRENKAALIEHLTKASYVPREQQIAALFPGGCTITMQPKGLLLADYINQLHNSETHVSQKKQPAWTDEQWRASEEVQYQRAADYHQRWLTDPIAVEEPYIGEEGFVVIPSFPELERI